MQSSFSSVLLTLNIFINALYDTYPNGMLANEEILIIFFFEFLKFLTQTIQMLDKIILPFLPEHCEFYLDF